MIVSFVYILELDGGGFYADYTADLRKRFAEHKAQKIPSSAGRNPRLQYVQTIATQRAAELRVAELKRLIESNPEQIRLMIKDFRAHLRESGLE